MSFTRKQEYMAPFLMQELNNDVIANHSTWIDAKFK